MSKWLKGKENAFNKLKEEKKQEAESQTQSAGPRRSDIVWKTPEKGTVDKAKIYLMRLLPDKKDNFYKTFFYHMYETSDGKWIFIFCPKTYNFENYCPFCLATMKLYRGSKEDKRSAYNYKRKRKHCVNSFIVKDPRDAEAESEEEKNEKKVLIYEFPDKVESKIFQEMNDDEYGNGMNIFDPGEDGVDFILKVNSTKPVQDDGPNSGKTFPDYSNSKFATNKPYALGSDKEIEKIMESTHDLDAYLKSMERTEEELIELAKEEMLGDVIDLNNRNPVRQSMKKEDIDELPFDDRKEDSFTTDEKKQEEDVIDDDALLKELEDL